MDLFAYMDATKDSAHIEGVWQRALLKAETDPGALFYIDTEFINDWLVEIAILNGRGEIIFHVTPLYKESWAEIRKSLNGHERKTLQYRLKRAGFDNTLTIPPPTGTLTAHEIVDVLKRSGWTQQSYLAEWSTTHCDWCNLERYFAANGISDFMMPKPRSLLGVYLWQKRLPGFWCFSLPILYPLLYPDCDLKNISHFALEDVQKFYGAIQCLKQNTSGSV